MPLRVSMINMAWVVILRELRLDDAKGIVLIL